MNEKLFLRAFWENKAGDFIYRLFQSHNKDGHWEELLASGDYEWAKRISEHYGLEIIGLPKELTEEPLQ